MDRFLSILIHFPSHHPWLGSFQMPLLGAVPILSTPIGDVSVRKAAITCLLSLLHP